MSISTPRTNPRAVSPENLLLGLLCIQPAHGYDLHQQIATQLGLIWHLRISQVYGTLDRLHARGWIAGQTPANHPRRTVFALTPAGRVQAEAWLLLPTRASVQAVRMEFPSRLYVLQQVNPAAVPGVIAAQAAEVRGALTSLRALQARLPADQQYNHLALQLRIQQLDALLGWLDGLKFPRQGE